MLGHFAPAAEWACSGPPELHGRACLLSYSCFPCKHSLLCMCGLQRAKNAMYGIRPGAEINTLINTDLGKLNSPMHNNHRMQSSRQKTFLPPALVRCLHGRFRNTQSKRLFPPLVRIISTITLALITLGIDHL